MDWDLADEFSAALIARGHRIVMWEADLIHSALSGSPGDVAARWDTPVGQLFRRYFADQLAADSVATSLRAAR